MGLIIAAVAGLFGYLVAVQPGGRGTQRGLPAPRPWRPFVLSLCVYVAMVVLIFAALLLHHCSGDAAALQTCLAEADRTLSFYVVAALAVACFVAGAFAGRRNGAQWWLMAIWPAPLVIAKLLAA